MKTRIHMCQSISGPLKNWSGKQWNDACDYITKDDGSRWRCGEELEHHFQELLDKGIECVPLGDCDNFDYKTGCKGHPIPD